MKLGTGFLLPGLLWSVCLSVCFLLSGCRAGGAAEEENVYQVYYLNRNLNKIISRQYEAAGESAEEVADELLKQLTLQMEEVDYHPAISGFSVKEYEFTEETVRLNFDEAYRNMEPTTEVLARAAIVKTLTQVEGLNYVIMNVNGETLLDSLGNAVGVMNTDTFIDITGEDLKNYEETTITLYFANSTGDKLVKVNRTKMYNTNISKEKFIVEQIISGPIEKNTKGGYTDFYPTVNPQTKIINVTVKDMICYVNLDKTFLEQTYNVTPEVTIYSIVNSLMELTNVTKVQILIDGETEINYRETYSLSTIFTANPELVRQDPETGGTETVGREQP